MSSQPIDKKLLKSLEPLISLSPDKVDELAQKSRIEKLPADRILFRQGDRNKRLYYLLAGQVEISINGQKKTQIIKAKTDQARYPLAEESPRPSTARSKTEVTVLNIDQDLLEILMGDSKQDSIEVTDLSGEHDAGWMLRFLQSPAFLHLPTENIQKLLMKLEEVPFNEGDVILRQGDNNDYYYIVQEGRCTVSRQPAPNTQDIKLAMLGVGDGFGEEALITGGKRNATVTMSKTGSLMRLGKADFLELLIKPLIHFYSEQEVIKNLAQGSLVIDVRSHEAFNNHHIEGSINIPLSMLRVKLPGLNPERDYIMVCDDGIQSEAAAFLLIQHGLNSHVLKNGLGATNIKNASPAAVAETTATKVETQQTRQADEKKHIALAKAKRLKAEKDRARQQASKLANQAKAAEQAKSSAEAELKRLKDKVLAQKDSALQSAQQQIQREMERAKKAELELKKLVSEQKQNAEHQNSLNQSLQQAEKKAQEQARVAQAAHKQAEREAEKIRQEAEKEAQRLRAEMEAERRQHEKAIEKARREEQHLQQRALKEAQREAERVALNTTRQAELEADKIRLKALQEAEQLRAEMESAKQLVEQEAQRVRMQQQNELKAQQQAEQAERERQQKLAEQERAEQLRIKQKQQEQIKQEKARLHAQAIKAKLEAAAKQKHQQIQEHTPTGGMSVGNFTVKESKDRILLESDEDSFIFKLPSITNINKEKLLKEAGETAHQKKEELPSFEVDSDEPMFPKAEPQFIGTNALDAILDDGIGHHIAKKKNYFAIAAAMVLAVGLGGFAYMKMSSVDLPGQTALQSKNNKTAASLLKRQKVSKNDIASAEKKVNKNAESEFETLLNKWKKSIKENEQ